MPEQIKPPEQNETPIEDETPSDEVDQIGRPRRLNRQALMFLINKLLGTLKDFAPGNSERAISGAARGVLSRMNNKSNEVITTESVFYKNLLQKINETKKEDMPCNKPKASTRPGKKKMVKACEGGKEKIVHFGAKGYGHNYSRKARKSFRARHKCGEKKSKLSAQYWACKNLWAGPKGSKASCPSNRQCKK